MNKLKFAILGCGGISGVHAEAIGMIPGAELAGCCDIDPARAKAFADKYGAAAYRSREELFRDGNIDAVCVCTPSVCHAADAREALESGKHVVLEKPMALTSAEADTVIAAADKNKRLVTVVSQTRYADDIVKARDIIRSGQLGSVIGVDLFMRYWREREYFSSSDWRGRKSMEGGGALMNQGIHGVSLLRYLMGEPEVTAASAGTRTHPIETEDTIYALLTYGCGAHGVIEAATCTWPGSCRRIEIMGDRGYLILTEDRMTRLRARDADFALPDDECPKYQGYPGGKIDPYLHSRQISELVSAVRDGGALTMDGREGRADIRLIEKIYEAAGI